MNDVGVHARGDGGTTQEELGEHRCTRLFPVHAPAFVCEDRDEHGTLSGWFYMWRSDFEWCMVEFTINSSLNFSLFI